MGAGVFAWAGGDITWTVLLADDPSPPYPSVSDFLYLAFYPASYASLMLVARSRTDRSAAASGSTGPSPR